MFKIKKREKKEKTEEKKHSDTLAYITKINDLLIENEQLKKNLSTMPKEIIKEVVVEKKIIENPNPPTIQPQPIVFTDKEIIEKKMKEAGIEPNFSLIENSFVSIPSNDKNKMFEEFLKILELFLNDENSFKTGRLDKSGLQNFPATVCETLKKRDEIIKTSNEKKIKSRYIIHDVFMTKFHIANSIQDIKNKSSKPEFFRDISTAFTQYKSWLMIQEAKHGNPEMEGEEGEPSEKLKRGILGG